MKKIFISMPYTHNDPEVVEYRIRVATRACGRLRSKGFSPVCPCVFGHQFIDLTAGSVSYNDWLEEAMTDIERCDIVFVLMVDGWEQSSGVQKEIELAEQLGKTVFFYSAWEERMEEVVDEIITVYQGSPHSSFSSFAAAEHWVKDEPEFTVAYVLRGIVHNYVPVHSLPIEP